MRFGLVFATLAAAALIGPPVRAQVVIEPHGHSTFVNKETSFLGVGVKDVDSERAKALRLKEERGAEVLSVKEGSAAAKAGIQVGDVILDFNGTPIESQAQLIRMVQETPAGRQVKIGLWRNGGPLTVTATIGAQKNTFWEAPSGEWPFSGVMPPSTPMPPMDIPNFNMSWQNPTLGIYGEALGEPQSEQLAEFFGVKEGVLVRSVTKNTAAEKAGIKAGDVIVKIDDTRIGTTRDITSTLRALRGKRTFTVTVVRNHKETPITVTMESANSTKARV